MTQKINYQKNADEEFKKKNFNEAFQLYSKILKEDETQINALLGKANTLTQLIDLENFQKIKQEEKVAVLLENAKNAYERVLQFDYENTEANQHLCLLKDILFKCKTFFQYEEKAGVQEVQKIRRHIYNHQVCGSYAKMFIDEFQIMNNETRILFSTEEEKVGVSLSSEEIRLVEIPITLAGWMRFTDDSFVFAKETPTISFSKKDIEEIKKIKEYTQKELGTSRRLKGFPFLTFPTGESFMINHSTKTVKINESLDSTIMLTEKEFCKVTNLNYLKKGILEKKYDEMNPSLSIEEQIKRYTNNVCISETYVSSTHKYKLESVHGLPVIRIQEKKGEKFSKSRCSYTKKSFRLFVDLLEEIITNKTDALLSKLTGEKHT